MSGRRGSFVVGLDRRTRSALTKKVVGESVEALEEGTKITKEKAMRKIVAGLFISLDGVAESPDQWHFPYFNDEMGQAVFGQMESADAMLLGRKTYEEFASYWPHQGPEVEPSEWMNGVAKYVVSSTLDKDKLPWDKSTLIPGATMAAELGKLKRRKGKNINITGSISLVRSLAQEGLLDELNLLVHPIVVNSGKKLFEGGGPQVPLKLVRSETFSTGVLFSTYAPAK
jgi:dihydrofolate reductase